MKNLTLKVYDNAKDYKAGKEMELHFTELEASQRLNNVLISKKIYKCEWIKSIKYTNYYSHKEIKVTHSNGVIDLYTYED